MKTPFQSFFLSLLSFGLLLILGGLSFLIFDRIVLEGKYTSPYNKDDVIHSLSADLNQKIYENSQLQEKLTHTEEWLEKKTGELESLPSYQLGSQVSNAIGPGNQVIFEDGRLVFREQTYFKSASSELTASAKNSLNQIINLLLRLTDRCEFPWALRVEGHADPQKEPSSYGFRSDWKIAFERAHAVVNYMVSKGVDAKKLYIASYSSYRRGPYPNNRRVSLSFDYQT